MITDEDIHLLLDRTSTEQELKRHFHGRQFSRRDIEKLKPLVLRRFGAYANPTLLIDIFGVT